MDNLIGPLFYRQNRILPPGKVVGSHCHVYDHVLEVIRGACIVRFMQPVLSHRDTNLPVVERNTADGPILLAVLSERLVEWGFTENVPKSVWHELEGVEHSDGPCISRCVFPNRDGLGKVIEQYIGNEDAFAGRPVEASDYLRAS